MFEDPKISKDQPATKKKYMHVPLERPLLDEFIDVAWDQAHSEPVLSLCCGHNGCHSLEQTSG
jgi:hypothetical protein